MIEDLLVDGYDYNPHTCMVEVPYNDYWDMKDKCKENKQLHSIIKEVRECIKTKYIVQGGLTSYEVNDLLNELLEILDKVDKENINEENK